MSNLGDGNIAVDLTLCVLLYIYNTNCMNKLKFNDFVQTKIQFIDCTHFFHQQNHPTFHSEDLERGSECFVSLSTLIVYDVRPPIVQRSKYVCMHGQVWRTVLPRTRPWTGSGLTSTARPYAASSARWRPA